MNVFSLTINISDNVWSSVNFLFFPPMTEGEIAHIVTTETEANQILEYNFQAEEI